jgi:tRNA threonylcarbamoyladenosine biosynthesis protein TsaB
LLTDQSIQLHELDAIAYGGGPGSFTGIRLATCLAQSFSFSLNLPIIRLSSLAILAMTAYVENQWDRLLVATNAHQQEIYFAVYALDEKGCMRLLGQEQQIKAEEIGPLEEGLDPHLSWYGIGNAWEIYKDKIQDSQKLSPKLINFSQLPSAKALALLAEHAFANKNFIPLAEALPVYLR